MNINLLDIEVCIGNDVYTWNGNAMEAIVSHYEEEKNRGMPRI